MKVIVGADAGMAREIDARTYDAVRSDFHVRVNDHLRPDFNRGRHARARMDYGCGVDHRAAYPRTALAACHRAARS